MDFAQVRAIAEQQAGYLMDDTHIRILVGAPAEHSAANLLFANLQKEIEKQGRDVSVVRTGSFGFCDFEPVAVVQIPERHVLLCLNADPVMAEDLDADAFAAGLDRQYGQWYVLRGECKKDIPHITTIPLISLQNRVVMRNCGWIDPLNLHQYILHGGGFAGLSNVLQKDHAESLKLLFSSTFEDHVRTGSSLLQSWRDLQDTPPADRCLVCNTVASGQGESFTRFILENDPLSILEGLLIGAYMLRASRCIVILKAGSAAAYNLKKMLDMMGQCNLVGAGILGTAFSADIEIREVPEDFRPGHMYASLDCIGQGSPAPAVQPAYSVFEDLSRKSVIITDPESAAFLPTVFLDKKTLETGFGMDRKQPSRVVSLSGSVHQSITAEIRCGVSIHSAIQDIGGGIPGDDPLRTVQLDAPRGIWLGPEELDSCAHCRTSGPNGMSDGNIDVVDGGIDILTLVADRMAAVQGQSCGKCLFCFEGSRQVALILKRMAAGEDSVRDWDLIKEIGEGMQGGCQCTLGRSAAGFVLSAAGIFRQDCVDPASGSPRNVPVS